MNTYQINITLGDVEDRILQTEAKKVKKSANDYINELVKPLALGVVKGLIQIEFDKIVDKVSLVGVLEGLEKLEKIKKEKKK